MSGKKGMVHYAIEVKREAVRMVEEEHLSYAEVAKRLEIRKAAQQGWAFLSIIKDL